MARRSEVHIGDVGTRYELTLYDGDVPYDPTTADDVLLKFEVPSGTVYERVGTVVADGSPAMTWQVVYVALAADGDTLHGLAGRMRMQVQLNWDSGEQFSSSIERIDDDGDELRVHPNIVSESP